MHPSKSLGAPVSSSSWSPPPAAADWIVVPAGHSAAVPPPPPVEVVVVVAVVVVVVVVPEPVVPEPDDVLADVDGAATLTPTPISPFMPDAACPETVQR